jgi:hypothetical protein
MSFTANPKSNLTKISLIALAAFVFSPSVGFALEGKSASEDRTARLKIEKQESEARVAQIRPRARPTSRSCAPKKKSVNFEFKS